MPPSSPLISMRRSAALPHEANLLDQRADRVEGFVARTGVIKRLVERRNLLPIDLGEVRVDEWRRRGRDRERLLKLFLTRLQRPQLRFQGLDRRIVLRDELHELARSAARF
jgi:hypothetical protein